MDKSIMGLLLLMLIYACSYSFAEGGIHSTNCPPNCMCTNQQLLVVNCSKLQLTDVPYNIPNDTQFLDLSYNHIRNIRPYAFSHLNNLQTLLLGNNNMDQSSINKLSFQGITRVIDLDLSFNYFPIIPRYLPAKLNNYYCLTCKMVDLSQEHFVGLKYMGSLSIQFNQIRNIASGTFDKLNTMTEVDLEFNNLTCSRIPKGVFRPLTNLTIIGMRFNPLGCIPEDLPASLQGLDLVGINLSVVKAGVLNHLVNLDNIALWQNNIAEMQDFAFKGLSRLTLMDINDNHIPYLNNKTLYGLTSLKTLYIYQNNITYIDQNAFAGMTKLQELWLGINQLTTMNPGLLKTFSLPSLNFIDITFNPMICDCRLQWMKQFQEHQDKVQDPHLITCNAPARLHGMAWDQLSYKNFTC